MNFSLQAVTKHGQQIHTGAVDYQSFRLYEAPFRCIIPALVVYER